MEALRLDSFSFSYPEQEPILVQIDWSLEEGSFALLTGATGSGKTTLLRNLKPELAPVGEGAGNITVFGRGLAELDPLESAQLIGYVGQDPDNGIVCDSVWHELAFGLENVGIGQELMRRRVAEVAHFFGLESWMHRETATLSGGQKQLVVLAGALVMQPKLLLLDEPTAQLDPVAEKNFLHALFRVNRELGLTVVVATHSPEFMRDYATHAFGLEEGRLRPVARADICLPVNHSSAQSSAQTPTVSSVRPITASFGHSPAAFPEHISEASAKSPLILKDLTFSYDRNKREVLRNLSLEVAEGSTHALVGGNGCGKSTLLKIMAGVLKPQYGKAKNALRGQQALLPQNPKALFVCDSVREELAEWQKDERQTDGSCGGGYGDDARQIVQAFHLEALLDRHPYDISRGQQQLVALAKLLSVKPRLLLLDEPTKGLDSAFRVQIARHLADFTQAGGTIVLATHDVSFIQNIADFVSLIFDGEVACIETSDRFFENSLFYRAEEGDFPISAQRQE